MNKNASRLWKAAAIALFIPFGYTYAMKTKNS